MLKKILVITFSLAITLMAGCGGQSVYNIEDAAVVASIDNLSSKDVQKAIIRAGSGLGWVMKKSGEGKITGTLHLRKHVAIVDINYSTKSYSIRYKDSKNLNYDGANIHKNYNSWIRNMNNAIQIQLNIL